MSAGTRTGRELAQEWGVDLCVSFLCLVSSAGCHAGTSCPADNKIWLSNKNYMNVCRNTCASSETSCPADNKIWLSNKNIWISSGTLAPGSSTAPLQPIIKTFNNASAHSLCRLFFKNYNQPVVPVYPISQIKSTCAYILSFCQSMLL